MRTSLSITILAAFGLSFWNSDNITRNPGTPQSAQFTNVYQDGGYAGLRLKRVAAGEDVNKNRMLDAAERMKYLEPGAYDNIHFIDNRKIKIYGMGMEFYGLYRVKNEGNKVFMIITEDTTLREPLYESSHKFEILAWLKKDSLLIVPPVFISMLCIYEKQK